MFNLRIYENIYRNQHKKRGKELQDATAAVTYKRGDGSLDMVGQ